MLDPVTTPLVLLALGNLASQLIIDACKDHLKDKLRGLFGRLEKIDKKDNLDQKGRVEQAYQDAMEQAYCFCLEMLLLNVKGSGYTNQELKQYQSSLEAFIKDKDVAEELLNAVRDPGNDKLPSPEALRKRWDELGGLELPSPDTLWSTVCIAYRRQAKKQVILSDDLRELENAKNIQEIKKLIERQGGVKTQVHLDKYKIRMRTKFSPVDLANLMPAFADDPGRMVIRDVFVAQNVRENPPPVEIPKDMADRLRKKGRHEEEDDDQQDKDEEKLERLHSTYVSQSPKPVLDVISAAGNRLLMLTGEPGSGKSTLMRYLLTGVIEPPIDRETNESLLWTQAFKDVFPLLIELRDFHALRKANECDSFLQYVDYMGKTEQWFLDEHTVNSYLENGPSLVMFDGLDEIFDSADRERVMHEIAGFAQRYPKARIIVTSRPVGYKDKILRNAKFAHLGLQDLDDIQIETFTRGWFKLTFTQKPQLAEQRTERVLSSVKQSSSIRLLAGNPMLLTIMVLLAREQELPRERAKFYEKAVEVLCHHWDANRHLELPDERYLNAEDKKDLLRRIAMRMQTGEGGLQGNIIAEDDLEQEIQSFLIEEQWQTDEAEAKKAARRVIHQLRERNYILCLRGPQHYGFVHRTFLEYLTAAEYVHRFHIAKTLDIDGLIALFEEHSPDDDWREVLRLICGQIDEQFVGLIVKHLATRTDAELEKWEGDSPIPELPLAIYCLSEVRNLTKLNNVGTHLMKTTMNATTKATMESESYGLFVMFLIPACRELGTSWPGREYLLERLSSHTDNIPDSSWGEDFWPHLVAHVADDRETVESLTCTTKGGQEGNYYRSAALKALAEHWLDDNTRKLLEERAVKYEHVDVRGAVLQALAEHWPDEKTLKLIESRIDKETGYAQDEIKKIAESLRKKLGV